MKQIEQLQKLQDALTEAHDYVSAHLITGGQIGGAMTPFNPRAEVLNQLRDALREITFRHERAPANGAAVAVGTAGLAMLDAPQVTA